MGNKYKKAMDALVLSDSVKRDIIRAAVSSENADSYTRGMDGLTLTAAAKDRIIAAAVLQKRARRRQYARRIANAAACALIFAVSLTAVRFTRISDDDGYILITPSESADSTATTEPEAPETPTAPSEAAESAAERADASHGGAAGNGSAVDNGKERQTERTNAARGASVLGLVDGSAGFFMNASESNKESKAPSATAAPAEAAVPITPETSLLPPKVAEAGGKTVFAEPESSLKNTAAADSAPKSGRGSPAAGGEANFTADADEKIESGALSDENVSADKTAGGCFDSGRAPASETPQNAADYENIAPYTVFETEEELKSAADFKVMTPKYLPEGYYPAEYALEESLARITYDSGEYEMVYRTGGISGDSVEDAYENEKSIDGVTVKTSSQSGMLANWREDDISFSLSSGEVFTDEELLKIVESVE